jgi:hypothetical protein
VTDMLTIFAFFNLPNFFCHIGRPPCTAY